MAGPVRWQYHLIWTPGDPVSTIALTAVNQHGTVQVWSKADMTPTVDTPDVAGVLEELYAGCLALMESAC
jgi:hypothetical protein